MYTMRSHMYERYKYPRHKSLLDRKHFLIEKICNLKCNKHNRKVVQEVTGKRLEDITLEIKEAEQMLLWVDCEIREKKSEVDLNCDMLATNCSVWVNEPSI